MPTETAAPASPIIRISPQALPDTAADLPHVLLVLDGFPKVLGGGERIVLRMAELLPRYGFRASILTFSLATPGEFNPVVAPCPTYLLPLTSTYNLHAWRGALAFRRFLLEQKVCLVQTFFESSDLWAGGMAKLLSPAKLVWSRRDMGILRGAKHRVAYRWLRKLPDAVFTVSEQVRAHVLSADGVPSSRVHTIYNGLEVDAANLGMRRSWHAPVHITCVGNIRPVKGHDVLVAAAALVLIQYPDTLFTIAGEVLDQPYYLDLQQQVASAGISGRFRFLGKLSDLPTHLAAADLFVLPSRSEGFSNALIEAMAAALPCVATAVGGNGEALQDGSNGLLVPPDDAEALAKAICTLLADPDRAQDMGALAASSVLARFTADAMMRAVTAQYRSLLAAE